MIEIQDIFEVKYGVNLELNKLELDSQGINFVSRTSKNNGVSAKVKRIANIEPIPEGVITVAGGGSVLETFLQTAPFYSGRDLYYLIPKVNMNINQKLFYCCCIRANKYKYNYGRQANRTLKNLLIPDIKELPSWLNEININKFDGSNNACKMGKELVLDISNWKEFVYEDLFDIKRGESLYLKNLDKGDYPYVSASSQNNGITAKVSIFNELGNAITLSYDGSIGEAFYQDNNFLSSEKIVTLRIKEKWNINLNKYIAMFLSTLIRLEKFRYNYGLKWSVNTRLLKSVIKLPIDNFGNPDWKFMENYIKSLPYSSSI